jgi:NAD(P)-dependent dehydrogenase (short-subunit alcohol dehydrogenase family)
MKGKVAIVTASSTGIGKGIVKRLAQEGCAVVVSSRQQNHID